MADAWALWGRKVELWIMKDEAKGTRGFDHGWAACGKFEPRNTRNTRKGSRGMELDTGQEDGPLPSTRLERGTDSVARCSRTGRDVGGRPGSGEERDWW